MSEIDAPATVVALAALMAEDVRLQLGNADVVNGKAEFMEALETFFVSVAGFKHAVINVWSDLDAVIAEPPRVRSLMTA